MGDKTAVCSIPRKSIVAGDYFNPLMLEFDKEIFSVAGDKFEQGFKSLDVIFDLERESIRGLLKKIRVSLDRRSPDEVFGKEMKFRFKTPLKRDELPYQIWWMNFMSRSKSGELVEQGLDWEWGNLGETKPPESYHISFTKNVSFGSYNAIGAEFRYEGDPKRIDPSIGLALKGIRFYGKKGEYRFAALGGRTDTDVSTLAVINGEPLLAESLWFENQQIIIRSKRVPGDNSPIIKPENIHVEGKVAEYSMPNTISYKRCLETVIGEVKKGIERVH